MKQPYYCGVQCIVMDQGGVLLGKRFRTAGEGQWALPGGHVENSETLIEAAARELLEETTLRGRKPVEGPSFVTYTTDIPYVHVPVVFQEFDGHPHAPPEEKFSDLRFFSIDRLPTPMFQPSAQALQSVSTFADQARDRELLNLMDAFSGPPQMRLA